MHRFNANILERIPSSFRNQAIQQLKASGVKQPTVSQIAARAHKATSATLNIGWGPWYVIGGDSSLLN